VVGVEIKGGKLLSSLSFDEVLRPLRRIVRDLATGSVTVTDLKLQPQMVAYVGGLGADLPDLSKVSGSPVPVEDISPPASSVGKKGPKGVSSAGSAGGSSGSGSGGSTASASQRSSKKTPSRGSALIPKSCALRVTNSKIAEIEAELRALPMTSYRHAISVLFRVFIELSVDEFLKANGIALTSTVPGGRAKDKALNTKVQEAVAHMISSGAPKKEFTGINKAMSDKNNPLHTDTLHAYVHNAFYSPTDRDLTVAWDNAQPFIQRLWP
jgi:hypothetical protein